MGLWELSGHSISTNLRCFQVLVDLLLLALIEFKVACNIQMPFQTDHYL